MLLIVVVFSSFAKAPRLYKKNDYSSSISILFFVLNKCSKKKEVYIQRPQKYQRPSEKAAPIHK
jgi:hypothetical protein